MTGSAMPCDAESITFPPLRIGIALSGVVVLVHVRFLFILIGLHRDGHASCEREALEGLE